MTKKIIKYLMILVIVFSAAVMYAGPKRVYVRTAPPVKKVVVVKTKKPYHDAVWKSGHWKWNGKKYVWKKGYWVKQRKGNRWISGHWKKTRHGWFWFDGHWKRR